MIDMSPSAVAARLREASLASDLDPDLRLHGKLDMSAAGVAARLREASDLYALSLELAKFGRLVL